MDGCLDAQIDGFTPVLLIYVNSALYHTFSYNPTSPQVILRRHFSEEYKATYFFFFCGVEKQSVISNCNYFRSHVIL